MPQGPKGYLWSLCGSQNQSSCPGLPNISWDFFPVSLEKRAGTKFSLQWLWNSCDIWAWGFCFLLDSVHFTTGVSLTKNKGAHTIKEHPKQNMFLLSTTCNSSSSSEPQPSTGGKNVKSRHQFQLFNWNANKGGQISNMEKRVGKEFWFQPWHQFLEWPWFNTCF